MPIRSSTKRIVYPCPVVGCNHVGKSMKLLGLHLHRSTYCRRKRVLDGLRTVCAERDLRCRANNDSTNSTNRFLNYGLDTDEAPVSKQQDETAMALDHAEELLVEGVDPGDIFGEDYVDSLYETEIRRTNKEETDFIVPNPAEYLRDASRLDMESFAGTNRDEVDHAVVTEAALKSVRSRQKYNKMLQQILDLQEEGEGDTMSPDEEFTFESLAAEIMEEIDQPDGGIFPLDEYEYEEDDLNNMNLQQMEESDTESCSCSESSSGSVEVGRSGVLRENTPLMNTYAKSVKKAAEATASETITGDSVRDKVIFSLLKLCKDANTPLYMYDRVMKWASDANEAGYCFERSNNISRKKVMKNLLVKLGMEGLVPKVERIPAVGTDLMISFTYFRTMEVIYSLLTDPRLMTQNRLLIDINNPCGPGDYSSARVDDILSTVWHEATYKNHHKKPDDFIVPLVFFYDGTAVGAMMKNSLYPISLTLGIFNRSTRGKAQANRLLGMLSSGSIGLSKAQRKQFKKTRVTAGSMKDMHNQMSYVLRDLSDIQGNGGFRHRLKMDDVCKDVTVKPFGCLMVGDCVGADEMCNHMGGCKTNRIHRHCMCTFMESDNPEHKCSFVTKDFMEMVQEEGSDTLLHSLSVHKVDNAFYGISWGEKSKEDEENEGIKESVLVGGIHLATPPEALHAISKGPLERVIKYLPKRMLTPSSIQSMDNLFQRLSIGLVRQSERNVPRFHFPKGFSDLTKVTASEYNGIAVVLILCLRSREGIEIVLSSKKITRDELTEYTEMLELLVCFLWWYKKNDGYDRAEEAMNYADTRIRYLLRKIKRVVKRKEGNRWKLKKFHQILHTIPLMRLYGAPANSDGGPFERNQKFMAKNPYATTQKRNNNAHIQTAARYLDYLAIDTAYDRCDAWKLLPKNLQKPFLLDQNIEEEEDESDHTMCGTTFHVESHERDGVRVKMVAQKKFALASDANLVPSKLVLSFVSQRVGRYVTGKTLPLCTEHKRKGYIFRSHPCYRSVMEWYDWAVFDFGDYEREAQILGFVDLRTNFKEDDLKSVPRKTNVLIGDAGNDTQNRRGLYAVVNELAQPPGNSNFVSLNGSRLVGQGVRKYHPADGSYRLTLINCETIVRPCIVVDHPESSKENECDNYDVMIMRDPLTWSDEFLAEIEFERGDVDLVAITEEEDDDDEMEYYSSSDDEE